MWENNSYKPLIRHYPKIIQFLEYNPLPKPNSFPEQLLYCRHTLGMNQKQFAKLVGFHADTIHSWEINEYAPSVTTMERLDKILLPILSE